MSETIPGFEYIIDLFAIFQILIIAQGLFLSVVFLFSKKHKTKSNIFFGFFLLTVSLGILESFLNYTRYILDLIWLLSFPNSLAFVAGPLFFLFVYSRLYGNTRFKWVHFIPFGLYFVFYLFYFNLQSNDFKLNVYIEWYNIDMLKVEGASKKDFGFINSLGIQAYFTPAFMLHLGTYLLLSLFYIFKYLKENKIKFYAVHDPHLRWLRNLSLLILLYFVADVFVKSSEKPETIEYYTSPILLTMVYFISFGYIRQSSFLIKTTDDGKQLKYAKSSLSDTVKQDLLVQLTQIMEVEKPYKDNLFSLAKLSKKLGVSSHHVSQLINEKLNQSFYELLANYRIEEAKRILLSNEGAKITIEQLAYEVGYNSKSAFNAGFKKMTGKSPSQFKKDNSQNI